MSLNAYRLSLLRRLEKEALEFPDEARQQIAMARAEEYKNTIFPNGAHLPSKPKDALISIMCPNVEGFDVSHMDCILATRMQVLSEVQVLARGGGSVRQRPSDQISCVPKVRQVHFPWTFAGRNKKLYNM